MNDSPAPNMPAPSRSQKYGPVILACALMFALAGYLHHRQVFATAPSHYPPRQVSSHTEFEDRNPAWPGARAALTVSLSDGTSITPSLAEGVLNINRSFSGGFSGGWTTVDIPLRDLLGVQVVSRANGSTDGSIAVVFQMKAATPPLHIVNQHWSDIDEGGHTDMPTNQHSFELPVPDRATADRIVPALQRLLADAS